MTVSVEVEEASWGVLPWVAWCVWRIMNVNVNVSSSSLLSLRRKFGEAAPGI